MSLEIGFGRSLGCISEGDRDEPNDDLGDEGETERGIEVSAINAPLGTGKFSVQTDEPSASPGNPVASCVLDSSRDILMRGGDGGTGGGLSASLGGIDRGGGVASCAWELFARTSKDAALL